MLSEIIYSTLVQEVCQENYFLYFFPIMPFCRDFCRHFFILIFSDSNYNPTYWEKVLQDCKGGFAILQLLTLQRNYHGKLGSFIGS